MTSEKLSRETWIAAGFASLAQSGPASLQINLLAARLGATKGSFYWHFKDLKDFKDEMLSLWRSKVATDVIDEVQRADTAEARFDVLLLHAARAAPEDYGGRNIEPAMRAWSLSDSDVAAALLELDTMRMAFVAQTLKGLGIEKPAVTELVYAAYIGLDDLHSKERADIGAALKALKDMILATRGY